MIYIYKNIKNGRGFAIYAEGLEQAQELLTVMKKKKNNLECVDVVHVDDYLKNERNYQA